jgi:hypothetical protein
MATIIKESGTSDGGGGATFLAFLVGGLVIVVALIAVFAFSGGRMPTAPSNDLNVNIKAPKIDVPAPQMPSVPAPTLPNPAN